MAARIKKQKTQPSPTVKITPDSKPDAVFGVWDESFGISFDDWLEIQHDELSEQLAGNEDGLICLRHLKIRHKVNHERDKIPHNSKKFLIAFPNGLVKFDSAPIAIGEKTKIYSGKPKTGELLNIRQKYALKISNSGDSDAPAMLKREYKTLESLQGKDGVPSVFCAGTMKDDRFGILMGNYRDYISLPELMTALGGSISLEDCVWVFNGVCSVLSHAEDHGIIHCAVLPEHILVWPETRHVVVVGWRTAVKANSAAIKTNGDFLPPEVRIGNTVADNTHVFGVAASIIQATGGKSPTAAGMPDYYSEALSNLMLSAFLPAGARIALDIFWTEFTAIVDGTNINKKHK